jgi:hypothetical protein
MTGQVSPDTPDNRPPDNRTDNHPPLGGVRPVRPVSVGRIGDQMQTKEPRPTWETLVTHEPQLAGLLTQAQAVTADREDFCANDVWYEHFKPALTSLVGWSARTTDQILRTTGAYDVAYACVYDALPACRRCGCL